MSRRGGRGECGLVRDERRRCDGEMGRRGCCTCSRCRRVCCARAWVSVWARRGGRWTPTRSPRGAAGRGSTHPLVDLLGGWRAAERLLKACATVPATAGGRDEARGAAQGRGLSGDEGRGGLVGGWAACEAGCRAAVSVLELLGAHRRWVRRDEVSGESERGARPSLGQVGPSRPRTALSLRTGAL